MTTTIKSFGRGGLVLGLALFLFAGFIRESFASEPEKTIKVAAAADLSRILPGLIRDFRKKTGVRVSVSYGPSGVLYLQITKGAPFDVFMSADSFYPDKLARSKTGKKMPERIYARGVLALWFKDRPPLPEGATPLSYLASEKLRPVALANPRVAPYGRSAVACLKKKRLLSAIRAKWVLGNDVSQVVQTLYAGAAPAGFVPYAQGKDLVAKKGGWLWKLPLSCYPPLYQKMIVLGKGEKEAGRRFLDFITGPVGQSEFRKEGYGDIRRP